MKKILLFIKLPPPTTGATLMNQYVADSKLLRNNFNIRTIGISYALNVAEMGKFRFSKVKTICITWLRLLYELIHFKPDLVYFQISPLGLAFIRDSLYVMIMKLFRKKIVFHLHGKGISKQIDSSIKRMIYNFVFKNQDVITLSKLLDYDVKEVFNGRIYHVPNGIPVVKYNNKVRDENSTIEILYLSNLIKSKGILDFVDAMEILKNKNLLFQANIVGKEADLSVQELTNLIKLKDLCSYVSYLGSKYGNEKTEIYINSDVLVFPTKYKNETFGIVNIEAMQFSIPVITTNEGAILEIIDNGITGYIVDKNSPNQIADKIEFLINNPDKRIEMGKAGRKKFLENYTIDKFEQNLKNVFDNILDS